MADPTKPYEGFGDPASRHVHIRARINYLISEAEKESNPDSYEQGRLDGLKTAIRVMDGE